MHMPMYMQIQRQRGVRWTLPLEVTNGLPSLLPPSVVDQNTHTQNLQNLYACYVEPRAA